MKTQTNNDTRITLERAEDAVGLAGSVQGGIAARREQLSRLEASMEGSTVNLVLSRGARVTLNLPFASPRRTLDGNLHEGGQAYTFLGTCGSLVRLSRVTDRAKLTIESEAIILSK